MSRRDLKILVLMVAVGTAITSGVMVGLRLLGARDELTAVLVVAAFAFTMLAGGFITDRPPPDRR